MTQPAPEIPNLAGIQQDLGQLAEPGRTLTLLAEQSSQVAVQRGGEVALPGLQLGLDGIAGMTHDLTRRLTHEFFATPAATGRRRERRAPAERTAVATAPTPTATPLSVERRPRMA